jgi:site-specific recombinase XerD
VLPLKNGPVRPQRENLTVSPFMAFARDAGRVFIFELKESGPVAIIGKDLLSLKDMPAETISLILDTAKSMKEIMSRQIKKVPTLRGKTIVTLFYESSTRTRSSFELAGYHRKSISAILTTLRSFLKFLYLKGYHEKDLSDDVPKIKQPHYPKIPSAWNPEDVKRVLAVIDRGNPNGKRDYAILLMVARLGMRVQDIKEIKLNNLNWAAKSIEIVQHKTKRSVSYPILDDIGWAIIDYLKNGRPQTESHHLFIRHHAPFDTFGTHANLHNIIVKYTRLAGIKLKTGAAQGMHSLRHTLASVLLEQETPLPVISEILGHMSTMSTSVYLKIDLEGLRKCALDPDEVFSI